MLHGLAIRRLLLVGSKDWGNLGLHQYQPYPGLTCPWQACSNLSQQRSRWEGKYCFLYLAISVSLVPASPFAKGKEGPGSHPSEPPPPPPKKQVTIGNHLTKVTGLQICWICACTVGWSNGMWCLWDRWLLCALAPKHDDKTWFFFMEMIPLFIKLQSVILQE